MSKKISWTDEDGTTYVGREKRRLPRKTIVAVIAGGLALVAGVAYALYMMTAGVDGQLANKSMSYLWTTQTPTVIKSTSDMTCTATPNSNGTSLTINVNGWPGDTCIVRKQISLTTPNGVGAVVVGFSAGTLPDGWKMVVDPASDCGTTLGGSGPTTFNGIVGFKVTVGDGASNGVAIPAGSGYQFAPSTQDTGSLVAACHAAAN